MKKKATVLFALISMCLVVTAGIGAISASDEAPCTTTTVGKINPDGTTTVIETFEGCSPMVVTVTQNEDGSTNITKEDRQITEEERYLSNAYKEIIGRAQYIGYQKGSIHRLLLFVKLGSLHRTPFKFSRYLV